MTKPLLAMPSLWAILPGQIGMTQNAYVAYLKGEVSHPPLPPLKGGIPKTGLLDVDLDKIPETFFMDGDIAVMQIDGIITPKADIFYLLFGGSTLDVMTRDFTTLVNADSVKAIVLDIDSPGGVAFGVEQFANLIFEARDVKPIFSITSTMMTSAAMWIGAAAEEVYITGEVVMTGSIGTVINHIDVSEFEKMLGIKTTEITAGRFKRIASGFKPLTEEGRAELQSQVDHVNDAFVADIARFRGVDEETVSSDMADGRTFLGSQGIEAGLIDEIISAEELIDCINASVGANSRSPLQRTGDINNFNRRKSMGTIAEKKATGVITAEGLEKDNPHVYAEIKGIGAREAVDGLNAAKTESFDQGRAQGKTEGEKLGAENELARIMDVEAQSVPGHEDLIASLKADGHTTGPEAAVAVIKADGELRKKGMEAFTKEASGAVKNDHEETNDDDDKKEKGFETVVAEYRSEHKCSKIDAMSAVAKAHPDVHKEYVANMKTTKA